MKILKYIVISIILSVSIISAGFLYLWMGKGSPSFKIPKIIPDLKLEGVHLTRAAAGKTEWELKARSASYSKEEGVTRLELPEVLFYGNGDKRIELKGDKGEVFNNTNDLAVTGNVKAVTSDGYTLNSDTLRYSSAKKVVTTDSRVFLKGNGIEVEGVGMLADMEQERVFIKSGVKAVLEGRL